MCARAFLQVRSNFLVALVCVVLFCRAVGTHRALRWPIFWLISACMTVELILYFTVRALIIFMEWCAFGMRRRERIAKFKGVRTFAEWRAAAEALDTLEGRDEWRLENASAEYDWRHIETLLEKLTAGLELYYNTTSILL